MGGIETAGLALAISAGLAFTIAPLSGQETAAKATARSVKTQGDAADDGALPLGSYLDRLRRALQRQEAAGDAAQQPRILRARASAESRSGVRRLRIREFQLLSDSDRNLAGYDLGAGSWQTEVGVLGSAVANEFLFQAAAAGITLDALDVIFTSHQGDAASTPRPAGQVSYPRNLQYTAHIVSSASDAQLETLRLAVERSSPVFQFVAQAQDIAHGNVVYTQSPATPPAGAPPGLRDFLIEKRAALLKRQEGAGANAAASPGLRAHVSVEGGTGLRRIRVADGRFQFIHDNPRELAGFDLGPTVEEHQLGVMATCLTHIFEIQAAQRQVVLDSLELEVEGTLTPRRGVGASAQPSRLQHVKYTVFISSPAPQPEIDALRSAVESVCPIYNLLKDPQPITGRIVRERFVPPRPVLSTAGRQ